MVTWEANALTRVFVGADARARADKYLKPGQNLNLPADDSLLKLIEYTRGGHYFYVEDGEECPVRYREEHGYRVTTWECECGKSLLV